MELYINNEWTECYGNSFVAEAIAWSENGNHASIYTQGNTAEEADAKLMNALRELKLVPGDLPISTSGSGETGREDRREARPNEENTGL